MFRTFSLYILLLVSALMVTSCAQHGCPGGMCMPSGGSYFTSSKSFKNKRHKRKFNTAKHINFGNSNKKALRQNNYKNNPSRSHSIEYNTNWNKLNRNTSNYKTNIEAGTFGNESNRVQKNRKLFRAKAYKEPKNKNTQSLWDPKMKDWQSQDKDSKKKEDKDTTKKKGKGVKKIR